MTRWPLVCVVALLAAGCGNGAPESAREAAREWVEAVNADDWARACELSAEERAGCERALARGFADPEGDLRLGGREGNAFTPSSSSASEVREGWSAYAPTVLVVERRGGRYAVHTEVHVIR